MKKLNRNKKKIVDKIARNSCEMICVSEGEVYTFDNKQNYKGLDNVKLCRVMPGGAGKDIAYELKYPTKYGDRFYRKCYFKNNNGKVGIGLSVGDKKVTHKFNPEENSFQELKDYVVTMTPEHRLKKSLDVLENATKMGTGIITFSSIPVKEAIKREDAERAKKLLNEGMKEFKVDDFDSFVIKHTKCGEYVLLLRDTVDENDQDRKGLGLKEKNINGFIKAIDLLDKCDPSILERKIRINGLNVIGSAIFSNDVWSTFNNCLFEGHFEDRSLFGCADLGMVFINEETFLTSDVATMAETIWVEATALDDQIYITDYSGNNYYINREGQKSKGLELQKTLRTKEEIISSNVPEDLLKKFMKHIDFNEKFYREKYNQPSLKENNQQSESSSRSTEAA